MKRGAVGQRSQRGVVAVEVGLVMMLFITLVLGVTGLTQLLWTLHAAIDATRVGARIAAVCDQNDSIIRTRMRQRLPALQDENIVIEYLAPGCVADSENNACRAVRVSLKEFNYPLAMGLASVNIELPPLPTTVPREYMSSTDNAVCH